MHRPLRLTRLAPRNKFEALGVCSAEEAMMTKKRRRILPRADINVTPFIDILLVLLVIFMTISPTARTGMPTNIPQQPPPGPREPEPEKVIVLSMDRNGVIRINQSEVEPPRLIGELQDIFKTRSDKTLFVQGDEDL